MIFDSADDSDDDERVILFGRGAMTAASTLEATMHLLCSDTTRYRTRGGVVVKIDIGYGKDCKGLRAIAKLVHSRERIGGTSARVTGGAQVFA